MRKAEKCEFRRQAVDAAEGAAIDEGLLGAELEVGQRRLTRGKAADMGLDTPVPCACSLSLCPRRRALRVCAPRLLPVRHHRLTPQGVRAGVVVEAIPDISEQALLGRSVAPRKTDEGAAAKAAGGGGDTSRKRQRDNDEDEATQTGDAAPSKKKRGEEEESD